MPLEIPMPPMRYRYLVGPLDRERFDNPTGARIDTNIPADLYDSVFDFGCGCGRLARQLMQQYDKPKRYLGIDINRRMIDWCNANLAPLDEGFAFQHHDVYNPVLGQFNARQSYAPFPCGDGEFTLLIALSVFTHILAEQAEFYLAEASRILRPGGIAFISWFFFDKRNFPMMQDYQNTLFINLDDPTNAVIYDRGYFETISMARGFRVREVIEGYQTRTYLEKMDSSVHSVSMPSNIILARLKERPNIPRHQKDTPDNIELSEQATPVPPLNSRNSPKKLAARLVTEDETLIDTQLMPGELFPCAFDVENTGEAAWFTVAMPDSDLAGQNSEKDPRTSSPTSGGKVTISLSWYAADERDKADPSAKRKHARQNFDFIQVTPVLQGEVARAILMSAAPMTPGTYRISLTIGLDGIDWPNGQLYRQTVLVVGQPMAGQLTSSAFRWLGRLACRLCSLTRR